MIKVTNLEFSYPHSDFRLSVPNLHIAEREHLAIVGPSGCGKTTLIYLMAGILSPDGGSVRIRETALTEMPEAERRRFRRTQIGFVFQEFELIEYLTVRDNIGFYNLIEGGRREVAQRKDEIDALAETCGVQRLLDRLPGRLSPGERQRVALCRALLNRPPLIIADEPTANLDQRNSLVISELLAEQSRQNGQTLVTVTHDPVVLDSFERVIDYNEFLTT